MGELLTKHHGGSSVDGDGFGGQSPSRQGAGAELSDPPKLGFDGGGASGLFSGKRFFFRRFLDEGINRANRRHEAVSEGRGRVPGAGGPWAAP